MEVEAARGDPGAYREDGAGVESQRPRLPAKVREPSKEEKEEHEASGCAVFRSWCPYCVQGRGQSNPHLPRQGASEIPEVCIDYAYDGRDGEETVTLLCARCPELDHYACTHVASKGQRHRLDYILVSDNLAKYVLVASAEPGLDRGIAAEDHIPVVATMHWQVQGSQRKGKAMPDLDKLKDADGATLGTPAVDDLLQIVPGRRSKDASKDEVT